MLHQYVVKLICSVVNPIHIFLFPINLTAWPIVNPLKRAKYDLVGHYYHIQVEENAGGRVHRHSTDAHTSVQRHKAPAPVKQNHSRTHFQDAVAQNNFSQLKVEHCQQQGARDLLMQLGSHSTSTVHLVAPVYWCA